MPLPYQANAGLQDLLCERILPRVSARIPATDSPPTIPPRQRRNSPQILDAAEVRFRSYGYRKTTMAEIAEDVDMSAANLYRYFEDKQDTAAACAGRCVGERLQRLRAVIREPGLRASERPQSFVLTMLRYTHEQAE